MDHRGRGAFPEHKSLLAMAVPLQCPAPNAELSLATDTSNSHIGGVMQQKPYQWHFLGFFSKKLNSTKSRYSTFDWELLQPAYLSVHHFRHFCEGHQFQLWTDHKPLVTAISQVTSIVPHASNSTWPFFPSSMCKCFTCLACKMSLPGFFTVQLQSLETSVQSWQRCQSNARR